MVIETGCASYTDAQRPTASLHQTVALMGAGHPHRTTLHGWLGGLGSRALGRLDKSGSGPPVAALIAESAHRFHRDLQSGWTHPHPISPSKYRSARRRDQLEACARLFDTGRRLFPQAPYAWSAWEGWLQARFHVTAWGFPARFPGTAIQQHSPRIAKVQCAPSVKEPKRQRKGKAHGARSPP